MERKKASSPAARSSDQNPRGKHAYTGCVLIRSARQNPASVTRPFTALAYLLIARIRLPRLCLH